LVHRQVRVQSGVFFFAHSAALAVLLFRCLFLHLPLSGVGFRALTAQVDFYELLAFRLLPLLLLEVLANVSFSFLCTHVSFFCSPFGQSFRLHFFSTFYLPSAPEQFNSIPPLFRLLVSPPFQCSRPSKLSESLLPSFPRLSYIVDLPRFPGCTDALPPTSGETIFFRFPFPS